MSFKKKSLAKLAKLRSKSSHNIPDDIDSDETQSSLSLQNKEKRMSLHSGAHLDIPLSKANAISTPNLGIHPIQPILHHFGSRSLSRNHSLKYLKSSLHGSNDPLSFDHNFEKTVPVSDGSRLRRRLLRKKVGGSIDSNEYPSTSSSESKELNTPRRVKSLRLAPIVRLENENGVQVQTALSPTEEVTSPISIPGTPKTARVPNAYAASRSPSISPTSTHSLNPNPYESSSGFPHSQSNSLDEDESDNNSEELPTMFFTPPLNGGVDIEQELRMSRRVSISKSRSMNSIPSSQGSGVAGSGRPPTAKDARGRSFLMGSMGPTSLLGAIELEKCFPDRIVRIFVGTWNMNGNSPPRHLAEFLLPQNLDYVPDIMVVGTQEGFPDRHEWEVRLQDTLGPTHVLYHSYSLGTLHQAIFLRRDLIWYCSVPETESINTRPGSQFKTKGAVATGFLLFGTSFLFVNSHLTAHEENIKDRIKDLKRINAMLSLSKTLPLRAARHKDISDKFDCVFWCGDLNFRIEQNRDYVIREVQDGMSVLEFDQLNYLRKEGLVFQGYKECSISFQPTFKYDVGTDTFDTSHKQRTPSYTDRILFKHSQATHLKSLYYDSVQGVLTSDHKPVWGMWEAQIRPGRDSIALAGGLFNREVYLDGLKRRAEALQPVLSGKNSSHMCNLQ
ncbi:inositol polyphosphate 5-phosphatase E-like [Tigriopus californicus]|uniref:inositol polyphosphate 5-phosphatase E-like n=1 Tax=Tigriopus californicus TaxID=6832 RepID=UPI0027DA6D75|nr:inositol polyphosphate 5-phosphatase E-like [Tigriopus californicus]